MADTKISALPAVSAAASTQELACNDSGISKKVSLSQLHDFLNIISVTQNDEGVFTVPDTGRLSQPNRLTLASAERSALSGTGRILLADVLNYEQDKGSTITGSFNILPDEYQVQYKRMSLTGNSRLSSSGRSVLSDLAGGGGTPGGANAQLQYNNSGAFGGIANATSDGTTLTLTSPVIAAGNMKVPNGFILYPSSDTTTAIIITDSTGTGGGHSVITFDSFNGRVGIFTNGAPGATLDVSGQFYVTGAGLVSKIKNVNTDGWGIPAIYKAGRVTAQSAANSNISQYTVGAADGSFEVSMNMNVTAATAISTSMNCTYTDESNTSRTMIFPVTSLTGAFLAGGLVSATGAYETPVMHIRCKASTTITLFTAAGTFTSVTYTAEGIIKQMA